LQERIDTDLNVLIETLPSKISGPLLERDDIAELLEVVLDLGRVPEARFLSGSFVIGTDEVTASDIQHATDNLGAFGEDNRAGIERTLHRISAIRNRSGKVVGLTLRVGRAVYGTIHIIEDLVLSGKSVLLLGKPGVGKTTMLREVARVLADDALKRVIVVDTSNEIAGDGDIPHPGIGRSRRMQVPTPIMQHAVMIEAVENHMPEVIVIDEIGTSADADAARTIAERGVQLVATAHGNTLDNLIMNPTLSDLVGGVQTVTLGDMEARRRGSQKSVRERRAPPTFDILVEIQGWNEVVVHDDVTEVVDRMLRGYPIRPNVRRVDEDGMVHRSRSVSVIPSIFGMKANVPRQPEPRREPEPEILPEEPVIEEVPQKITYILPYGVNKGRLIQAVESTRAPVEIVDEMSKADLLLTTKNFYRRRTQALKTAEQRGKPVYVLRKNTLGQIEQFVKAISRKQQEEARSEETYSDALEEAETAVNRVDEGEDQVGLNPQGSYVRRLQHKIADKYGMSSTSAGREPERRVVIYRR
jgi:stage III sporulation protein SpoIIIAA